LDDDDDDDSSFEPRLLLANKTLKWVQGPFTP